MRKSGKGMLRWAAAAALMLTLLLAGQAFADTLPTLGPSSRSEADRILIQALQEDLKEKGYYNAKAVTSTYTSALKSAVRLFQIANDLKPKPALGYADEQTQLLAASDKAVVYQQYVEKLQDAQLKLGGSGAYVTRAQRQLTRLGFYSGKIDGRYRTPTVNAVKSFQTAVKYFQPASALTVSGNADGETRAALYSESPVTRAQYEDANYLTQLRIGAKGDQVTQLQGRLAAKGFYWGEPTGVYDAQTRYSVRFFQEANGFSVNGVATKALRTLANTDSAVSFETYTKDMHLLQLSSRARPGIRIAVLQLKLRELGYYTGVITGVYSSQVISAVRTFQVFNNMNSKYATGKANLETRKLMLSADALTFKQVSGDNTLRLGNSGAAVESLQARLKELGYYKGAVDGTYSRGVASAVKLLQRYNGLYPTGVAYTNTLAVLNSASAKSYINANVEKLLAVAESHLGDRYVLGKQGPSQFDCSGFTYYCLRKMGIKVPAEVRSQARTKFGSVITDAKELKRGDIVYFWSPDRKKKPGHAGIFRGKDSFIHASSTKKMVVVSDFTDYNTREGAPWFLWAIRIWE